MDTRHTRPSLGREDRVSTHILEGNLTAFFEICRRVQGHFPTHYQASCSQTLIRPRIQPRGRINTYIKFYKTHYDFGVHQSVLRSELSQATAGRVE